jgi:hypothetical protein
MRLRLDQAVERWIVKECASYNRAPYIFQLSATIQNLRFYPPNLKIWVISQTPASKPQPDFRGLMAIAPAFA